MPTDTKWSLLVPSPRAVLDLLREHHDYLLNQWWATFSVAAVASLFAMIAALLLATFVLRFRAAGVVLSPLTALSQSFPLQALAPLIIVAFGVGFATKLFVAFVIAFFPRYAACLSALRQTPARMMARTVIADSSFLHALAMVRFPWALPTIVAATKVGFTLAVLGAVVAEFIQPDAGIGHVLIVAQSSYNVELIYACILLLALQGVLTYATLSYLEYRLTARRKST